MDWHIPGILSRVMLRVGLTLRLRYLITFSLPTMHTRCVRHWPRAGSMRLSPTTSCNSLRSTCNVRMWMHLRPCFVSLMVWCLKFRHGFVHNGPLICSLPCKLQSRYSLHLQILPTLKSMGQNVMLLCPLPLSRF